MAKQSPQPAFRAAANPLKGLQFLRGKEWIALSVLLFILGFVVYLGVMRQELTTWDDDIYVTNNAFVTRGLSSQGIVWAFKTDHANNYHPLTWLSLQLDAELFGNKAWGYKLTSVLLHGLNGVLLFLVLWRMTEAVWPSFFVAGLFLLHPLHVESVAWVSERKDVLSTFFILLALHAYVQYAKAGSIVMYVLMLVAYLASLLSKQMYVTFPFLILLLDYWPLERIFRKPAESLAEGETPRFKPTTLMGAITEKLVPLSLALAASALVYQIQVSTPSVQRAEFGPLARVGNSAAAYGDYLRQTFVPFDLAFFYPYPEGGAPLVSILIGATAVIGLSALAIIFRARAPYLFVGWFWFLGLLLPVIGLVQVGFQARADRYTYLPLVGIFIVLAFGAAALARVRRQEQPVIIAAGAIALLLCFGFTWFQVATWNNTESLARAALVTNKNNYVAHAQLASALVFKGKWDEAKEEVEQSIAINPDQYRAQMTFGVLSLAQGKTEEGAKSLRRALELNPDGEEALLEVAILELGEGDVESAAKKLERCMEINRANPRTRIAMAVAKVREGKPLEAKPYIERLALTNPEAKRLLALLERLEKKDPTAENRFRLLFQWPVGVTGSRILADVSGLLLQKKKMTAEEADKALRQALEVWPNNLDALYNRGIVLLRLGDAGGAAALIERVVQLDPSNEEARRLLTPKDAGTPTPGGLRNAIPGG